MCGGDKATFQKALPVLQAMGKNIVHCGAPGFGQATKICNNMVAGIISLANAEAFVLGEKLGDGGRIVVRASGTEPLVRIMVEAEDPHRVQEIAQHLAHVLRTEVGEA